MSTSYILQKSKRKDKRYALIIENNDHKKTINFGMPSKYKATYIDHGDK